MKILVVYYSMYGHVFQLARAVEEGAKSVAGARFCSAELLNLTRLSRKPRTMNTL